jgi:hypothetical protein
MCCRRLRLRQPFRQPASAPPSGRHGAGWFPRPGNDPQRLTGQPGLNVFQRPAVKLPVALPRHIAQVRGQHGVGGGEEGVACREGFVVEDVQRGSRDPAFRQRPHQGVLVHQRPARGVHQNAVGAQEFQLGLAHDALRTGRQAQVEGGDVGISKELILGHLPHPCPGGGLIGQVLAPREHVHAKRLAVGSHPAADLAQAHHPEGLAGQFEPHRALPGAGAE